MHFGHVRLVTDARFRVQVSRLGSSCRTRLAPLHSDVTSQAAATIKRSTAAALAKARQLNSVAAQHFELLIGMNVWIRDYHRAMTQLAERALDLWDLDRRTTAALTVAVPHTHLPEVLELTPTATVLISGHSLSRHLAWSRGSGAQSGEVKPRLWYSLGPLRLQVRSGLELAAELRA